jgi:hypothetical protein
VIGTVCILCFLVCCIPSHHLLVWWEQKQIYGQGCAYCLRLLQLCGGPWNSVEWKAVCSILLAQDHSQSTPGPLQGTHPGTVIATSLNLLLLRSFVCCDSENQGLY